MIIWPATILISKELSRYSARMNGEWRAIKQMGYDAKQRARPHFEACENYYNLQHVDYSYVMENFQKLILS